MSKKTILKTLAMAMLMPAMLLTTACSSEDDLVNNTANTENTINKGYALPVTVNVTRQGDATTRATFDGSKLNFGAGDKLFVSGYYGGSDDKQFAGMLEYDTESGKFSGTIYTESEYTGTAEALLAGADDRIATLVPAGYDTYGYLSIKNEGSYGASLSPVHNKAFALTKKAAVEQFSLEQTNSYSSGFTLAPENGILNFTISGLTANKEVAVSFDREGTVVVISGNVTTSAEGVATFAVGVHDNCELENCTLTVDGNPITLPDKEVEAGKIYNIARNVIPGALIGVFSVSDTKKVYFSKGNLQYDGTNWKFAASQWEVLGANGTGANGTATNYPMDLFTWGNIDSPTYNGTTYYTENADLSGITDWGSRMGSGWCTLTKAEWSYLFYTRTVNGDRGADYSFTLGQSVSGKLGVVIYPDNYTGAVYSGSNWSTFESAGCVFLPAAGYRGWGTDVDEVGSDGYYWSSTAYGDEDARYVYFDSEDLNVDDYTTSRYNGHSVRLVRPVQ